MGPAGITDPPNKKELFKSAQKLSMGKNNVTFLENN